VVPTLIAWPQSTFVYDRKGELWHITADHRKTFSHVFYFAPTDPNTVRWNPLFEVRKGVMEIADIQNVVGILVDPLGRKAGDLNFWDQSATDFFTAVILHVLYSEPDEGKNLAQVRRLLINIEPTLHAMMNTQHRLKPDLHAVDGLARDADGQTVPEIHPEVLLGARALHSMEERVKSNVLATCRASLSLWADPLVEYATSWSDFSIGDLVCAAAPVSFYIITPQAHADRLAFLVRVFTRQTINSLMESEHADSRRRRKRHRLLLLLDEFPKLGSLPFLENAMGEMAGYGITAHLICQSFNDVFSKYGDKTPLFDNMHITAASRRRNQRGSRRRPAQARRWKCATASAIPAPSSGAPTAPRPSPSSSATSSPRRTFAAWTTASSSCSSTTPSRSWPTRSATTRSRSSRRAPATISTASRRPMCRSLARRTCRARPTSTGRACGR
jgi:type IV secretion system protein VirD4